MDHNGNPELNPVGRRFILGVCDVCHLQGSARCGPDRHKLIERQRGSGNLVMRGDDYGANRLIKAVGVAWQLPVRARMRCAYLMSRHNTQMNRRVPATALAAEKIRD